MKWNVFYLMIFVLMYGISYTQTTSSGKCYYNDYHIWDNNGQPDLHGDCGNNSLFNTGNQLTMEVWVRAYTFGENRKILGKLSPALNDGYVMGFGNLNIYSEIMNPTLHEISQTGVGSLPLDSAWVHLATSYSSTGQMINYINGENVGEITVFPQNPIAQSTNPFIIGRAPWSYSFLFYGGLDEVRIWNVEKTGAEIKANMHKQLSGNEPGLVAYYNFNNPSDSIFYDQSPNGLDGVMKQYGHPCFSWKTSYAPVGDVEMYNRHNISGAWCGKSATQFNYAVTNSGVSAIAQIQNKEFEKYVIFGHNDSSGTSTVSLPATAPVGFKRLSRNWYFNESGGVVLTQFVFNLTEAANGGDELPQGEPDSLYTLLKWDDVLSEYIPVYSASMVYNNSVIFNEVPISSGIYTLGYGSTKLAGPASVDEIFPLPLDVKVYPNPANDQINIEATNATEFVIFDYCGRVVLRKSVESNIEVVNTETISSGLYMIRLFGKDYTVTKKILINK